MRIPIEPDRERLRSGAIRGVGWAAVLKIGTQFGSVVTFVLLARLLEPQDFGLVALANAIVVGVTMLFDLSVGHYLVQQRELGKGTIDSVFWTALVLGCLVATVVSVSAPLVSDMLREPQLTGVLVALALTVPIASLSAVPHALLRRSLVFDVLTKRGLIAAVISAVTGVTLAVAGWGVWALVAQAYVLPVVGAVLFYGVAGWRPGLSWDRRESIAIVRYGLALWGMSSLNFLRTRGDDLIVGGVLGSANLGIYTVAKRIVINVCDLFAGVAQQVVPAVLAAAKGDPDRVRRGYLQGLASTSALIAPVTLCLAAASPKLVPLVFGSNWEGAGLIAQVVALGAAVSVFPSLDRGLFLALDMPRVEVATAAVTTAFILGAMAVAVPWGLASVAVAGSVAGYLAWGWRVCVAQRRGGIRAVQVLTIVTPIWVAAVGCASLALVTVHLTAAWSEVYSLGAAAVVSTLAYPPLLRSLASPTVRTLRNLVPVRLRRSRVASLLLRYLVGSLPA